MHRSKIEWVLNPDNKTLGWIWNPLSGCRNHVNGLCKGGGFPCYAYRLAHGRLKRKYWVNENLAPTPRDLVNYSIDPFYPRFWPSRLYQPTHIKKPIGIFTVDMGELFGDWVPQEWQERIFNVIKSCPQHRFYLLTKQPQNLIKFSPFPDNCWAGVTATDQETMYWAIYYLQQIKAKIKYLSIEPLLQWKSPREWLTNPLSDYLKYGDIRQVITGAQTKPYKPPKIEWVKEIVEAADEAGIPVFLKDNLSDLIPVNSTLRYGPAGELRLRQEMPK